jgi:23S rRNA (adenine2503-C2)-methyltransferase
MWAVTLLAGVNDTEEHARALAERVHAFTRDTGGLRPRLSLVPYNAIARESEVGADPFERTSEGIERAYRNALAEAGVRAHRRYSGGADVRAACGQLAATYDQS